jgi:quinoprotein glucose dehydrogenase
MPTRTTDDGVFSIAQAERGRIEYSRTCTSCHFEDLLGDDVAPALAGPTFWTRWEGAGVHQLADVIRTSMPPTAPGSIEAEAVADIIGYLLETNGSPAGDAPLDPDPERLRRILLREPAGD